MRSDIGRMTELANFLGLVLGFIALTTFVALPLSFAWKRLSLVLTAIIIGFPGSAFGAFLLFASPGSINTATITVSLIPILSYVGIIVNLMRYRQAQEKSTRAEQPIQD